MIYITGDTHNDYESFVKRIPSDIKKEDTLIVTGDFGFVKPYDEDDHLEKIKGIPCQICFVDGNHENFPEIYKYPVEIWNGGNVHKIAENIRHMMRGEVYTINGKTFFTFGGASSPDKARRKEGVSWFEEELPTNEEYENGLCNLKKLNNKVDYIITHTLPSSIILKAGFHITPKDTELTNFLENIYRTADFKEWFAGHFHIIETYERVHIMYFNVENI